MANPRALFNEMVQVGKLKLTDYPIVNFKDGLWHASKCIDGVRHEASRSTKTAAVDEVLKLIIFCAKIDLPEKMDVVRYCCDKKCFESPEDQVDGIACDRCESFSYCRCNCVSFPKLTALQKLTRARGEYTMKYHTIVGEVCHIKISAPLSERRNAGVYRLSATYTCVVDGRFVQEEYIDRCIETFLDELKNL